MARRVTWPLDVLQALWQCLLASQGSIGVHAPMDAARLAVTARQDSHIKQLLQLLAVSLDQPQLPSAFDNAVESLADVANGSVHSEVKHKKSSWHSAMPARISAVLHVLLVQCCRIVTGCFLKHKPVDSNAHHASLRMCGKLVKTLPLHCTCYAQSES